MNEEKNNGRMSVIVRTIASSVFPFIVIFSFYIIMHGHLTPGGGFQGGSVAASAIVMMIAAYGYRRIDKKVKENSLSCIESIGAVIFVVVAFVGLFMAASFMYNFLVGSPFFGEIPHGSNTGILNSGGILPILNIAVGLKVMAGLSAVVAVMALSAGEKK